MATPSWLADIDWDGVADEAQTFLCDLLRIDTSNPPGNELTACRYIADLLAAEGIDHEVFEVAPGRANLVARVPGKGTADPVLLATHLDVVPANAAQWTHPPFSGTVADGYIWGRGAVDMKNMAAMELAFLVTLHRHHRGQAASDVIFAAVADEEAGCELGSLWLAENHPDKVRARYAFGEVGGFTVHVGKSRICPVEVAEKGVCWLEVRARGQAGHGSLPGRDNAVARIGEAAARLAARPLPLKVTPVVRHFVNAVAAQQPFPRGVVLKQILSPLWSDLVLQRVLPDLEQARLFEVQLHDTAAPTVLRAGDRVNVIPGEAVLQIDGRTLPGQTDDDLIQEIRAVIGDDLEIAVTRSMPPVEGDVHDPVLAVIQEVLDELDPGTVAVPNLLPGFTDAKAWSSLGCRCIGFSPIRLGPDESFAALFHGVDERIPVDGFRFGVRALGEVVARVVEGQAAVGDA